MFINEYGAFHCPFEQKGWSLAPFINELECRGTIELIANLGRMVWKEMPSPCWDPGRITVPLDYVGFLEGEKPICVQRLLSNS